MRESADAIQISGFGLQSEPAFSATVTSAGVCPPQRLPPFCWMRREISAMKKQSQFDFDAECNFSGLPPHEIETACKYEYMRESKGLRGLCNSAEASIAPYLSKLSRSCKPDCPRQYRLQQNKEEPKQYRFHCSHCDQAVNVPRITIVRWKRQLGKEHRLSARRVRPSFADEFGWDATLRLVLALRNAGFPKPWKLLSEDARQGLIKAITGWDNERKGVYPPVAIESALERDLEANKSRVLVSRSGALNPSSRSFVACNS
jgi:hypothetical protein